MRDIDSVYQNSTVVTEWQTALTLVMKRIVVSLLLNIDYHDLFTVNWLSYFWFLNFD